MRGGGDPFWHDAARPGLAVSPSPAVAPLVLDAAAVRALLPHAGTMCLLAGVRAYDHDTISCVATGHRHPAHPLRARGRLGAACAIEYAAQAMAVHGALGGLDGASRGGALLAVRDLRCAVARLDDQGPVLAIVCQCRTRADAGAVYDFQVSAAGPVLVSGRATVRFGLSAASGSL